MEAQIYSTAIIAISSVIPSKGAISRLELRYELLGENNKKDLTNLLETDILIIEEENS